MRFIILCLLFLSTINVGYGQKRELRAYLDNKQFFAPGVGNYVEFHLQFVGYSINYKAKDNGLIGELAIKMEISQNNEIVTSDAYRLSTPFMKDSIIEDFYDLKRFALEPGEYLFSIQLQDINSKNEPLSTSQSIIVDDLSDAISISDIEIAEYASKGSEDSPFYKSGFNIIPRLSTFYPEELTTIPAYFEIYNVNLLDDSVFAVKQTVVNASSGNEIPELTSFSKHDVAEVVPIMKKIDISKIVTGKYIVNYTILNRNMRELATQSYEFERSNDIDVDLMTDELILDPAFQESITDDSVGYYLESLIPISRANGVRNIISVAKTKNSDNARKYIQLFWTKTAPDKPYENWIKYKKQVQLVEKLYANNFQEGFETDRGRVYLQYGSPTYITVKEHSPSEYPYEIWQYNKIGSFSNKKFVFYNPDLVNRTYRLLHSDMVGELKNPSWPRELSKRNTKNGNIDDPNGDIQDHWGGNSKDLINQF